MSLLPSHAVAVIVGITLAVLILLLVIVGGVTTVLVLNKYGQFMICCYIL